MFRACSGLHAALAGALWACELPERSDFLVGRACVREPPTGCESDQACLPHAYSSAQRPTDFRCRDAASFQGIAGREAPIAYCLPDEGLHCPEGLVCGAGRIRVETGPRRTVCKTEQDGFGPPLDAGSGGT